MNNTSESRRLNRAGRLLVVALALLAVLGVTAGVARTVAAWNDRADFSAQVKAGTWSAALAANSCEVRNADGALDSTRTCSIAFGSASFWGSAGAGYGNFIYTTSVTPAIDNTQYVRFTLTLTDDYQVPSWWSWANARIATFGQGTATSACSALPTISGRKDANIGSTPGIYMELRDFAGTPRLCS